ncbi:syntenin-1-like [Cimex lectularius]|uniref:PDZ domain-containing protein n=1 Tax=Cimex lectularius TaxID=79782 RepID=A0A8I6SKI7_CIMLE|nr:syntenin-1-like [Cimex lectularius]XP_024082891.1 syntenin-1-like [Cimex lectularius]
MSLYPSLEDMKVGQMVKAQIKEASYPTLKRNEEDKTITKPSGFAMHQAGMAVPVYPSLTEYMGLDLSNKSISMNIPDYSKSLAIQQPAENMSLMSNFNNMVAPLSGNSLGFKRANVTNGIRELFLCKDKDGKVGVRVASVNSGIFVCLVTKGSPAEMGGLRFGDQILQVNGTIVAGFSVDQVHKLFKKAPVNEVVVVVRDRPFERTVILHKNSLGHVGFQFKKGEIVTLVKDSSASRNGLLTQHQLLEVDGQNVVGLKDKEITAIIEAAPSPLTVTIIPVNIYEHIINKMSPNLMKNLMSHSIPAF